MNSRHAAVFAAEQQTDGQMFPAFPLLELWSNWVEDACQPALSKFLILDYSASTHLKCTVCNINNSTNK